MPFPFTQIALMRIIFTTSAGIPADAIVIISQLQRYQLLSIFARALKAIIRLIFTPRQHAVSLASFSRYFARRRRAYAAITRTIDSLMIGADDDAHVLVLY